MIHQLLLTYVGRFRMTSVCECDDLGVCCEPLSYSNCLRALIPIHCTLLVNVHYSNGQTSSDPLESVFCLLSSVQ